MGEFRYFKVRIINEIGLRNFNDRYRYTRILLYVTVVQYLSRRVYHVDFVLFKNNLSMNSEYQFLFRKYAIYFWR